MRQLSALFQAFVFVHENSSELLGGSISIARSKLFGAMLQEQ